MSLGQTTHSIVDSPHRALMCRGVRGATIATENSAAAIREAILDLVQTMIRENRIVPDDLASAFFTTTPDLDAAFPAEAIRHMGWEHVPMLGAQEMAKPGAPTHCIRVLLHWNTTHGPREIRHVYLRGTEVLRTAGSAPIPSTQAATIVTTTPTAPEGETT